MNHCPLLAAIGLALLLSSAAQAQLPALPAPEVFAPGAVSGPQNDGAPTFTPDGGTVFFGRSYAHRSVIMTAHRQGAGWSAPQVAAFSGPTSDQQPTLAPGGRYLLYVSGRRRPAAAGERPKGYNHIFRVDRIGAGWSAPRELPGEVNIADMIFRPSVAADGDVYFMSAVGSDADGPRWRLFRSAWADGRFRPAEPLPFSDGKAVDVDPCIAPDGRFLIFSSRGRDGSDDGRERLYIAVRQGQGWGPVRPLRYAGDDWGGDDGEAQVSPDSRRLYFTSTRSAPVDRAAPRPRFLADIRRAEAWDNGSGNAWSLPLASLLAANGVSIPG